MNLGTSLLLLSASVFAQTPAVEDVTYWKDIQPIIKKRCVICHSDKNLSKPDIGGELSLESFKNVTQTSLVKSGDSAKSPLYQRVVTEDEDLRMPLDASPLKKADIETIARWINSSIPEGTPSNNDPPPKKMSPKRLPKKDLPLSFTLSKETLAYLTGADSPEGMIQIPVAPLPVIGALEFSPDGSSLVIGSNRLVTIWDVQSASVKATLDSESSVHSIQFNRSGTQCAIAGGRPAQYGSIMLVGTEEWSIQKLIKLHEDAIYGISFHPTKPWIASASLDSTIGIWDMKDQKTIRTLKHHTEAVFDVSFTANGGHLASASRDRSVKIISTEDWSSIMTVAGHEGSVTNLVTSPDSVYVFSAGKESDIQWSQIADGQNYSMFSGHSGRVQDISLTPSGTTLASIGTDETLRVFGTSFGEDLRKISLPIMCTAVAIHPTRPLIATGGKNGVVHLWNYDSEQLLGQLVSVWNAETEPMWIVLTSNGFFAGTASVMDEMKVSTDDKPVDRKLFVEQFHNPEKSRLTLVPEPVENE